jgi:hypothetical protein
MNILVLNPGRKLPQNRYRSSAKPPCQRSAEAFSSNCFARSGPSWPSGVTCPAPAGSSQKLIDLFQKNGRQIAELLHLRIENRSFGYRDDSIVANNLGFVLLPQEHHANQPAGYLASRKGWLVAQHKHIRRIAILAFCPREVPKVKGNTIPSGITFDSLIRPVCSSILYLFRLPRGVSMTTSCKSEIPPLSSALIDISSLARRILQASPVRSPPLSLDWFGIRSVGNERT